jgi:competence ComEA-like helix-hairpin-helix protein
MLNDFLYFSRTERIGVLVLAILAIILLLVPSFLPDRSEHDPSDFSVLAAIVNEREQSLTREYLSEAIPREMLSKELPKPFLPNQATVDLLEAVGLSTQSVRAWMSYLSKGGQFNDWEDVTNFRALSEAERKFLQPYLIFPTSVAESGRQSDEVAELVFQPFDPNRVEEAQLLAMGVPPKAASNWLKFLLSGGHFKQATDIQKIYGLPPAKAEALLPYVQIENTTALAQVETEQPLAYEGANTPVILDINEATAAEWQALRGIGPAYSQRIVNFRDKLGGFVSVEQVAETYGLPDSVFQAIYLQLRPSSIFRPLLINQLGVAELAAHPYLSKTNARAIVQYREEHGPYQRASDLEKLYGLTDEVKKNILPYLVFE